MVSKKYYVLCQFIVLLSFVLHGESSLNAQDKPVFERGLKGLPAQKQGNMIRDREGFLWFCYYGGIARYDGSEVKYYKAGENSVSGPGALSIVMDRDGLFWILTKDNGLTQYDKERDKFTHYRHDPFKNSISSDISDGFGPQRLFVDRQNRLLIGTINGFNIYDKRADLFKHYFNDPHNPNSLSNNNITAVLQDKEGLIWIGTGGGGLNCFNEKTDTWKRYKNQADSDKGPCSNTVWSLLEDRDGTIWVGTWDGGLSSFNKETERFLHYRHDPDNHLSLGDNKIYNLYEDSAGRIWISHRDSDIAGIESFNKKTAAFIRFSADPGDPTSISSNFVSSVYEDPVTGILWVIHAFDGVLDKYDRNSHQFKLHQHNPFNQESLSGSMVVAMLEEDKDRLWLSVNNALDLYDKRTGRFIHYSYDEIGPLAGPVTTAMCRENDNYIWLLSSRGVLSLFDTDSLRILEKHRYDPANPSGIMLSTSPGGQIIKDRDEPDIIWLALSAGLEKFNKKTKEFTHFIHDANDSESITSGTVWSVYDDGKGFLWVSTFGGLNRFDKKRELFTRFVHNKDNPGSIGDNKQACVFEDSLGNFWVGGFTNGIDLLDRKTGVFKHFNKENGFPDTGVNLTIQEDSAGHLWLGTTGKGLIKFNIRQQKVVAVYSKADGLQDNDFWRSIKKQDGEMWFAGGFGVNSFYPEDVKKNLSVPPVVLTSLTQGGKRIDCGKAPERLKNLTFGWKENFFEFRFAALNYNKPEKNNYAYMLQGRDNAWYYCGNNPSGRYTGLEGGDYTLRLKGSNNDGIWNEEGFALKIKVIKPFWKSFWFYSFVCIMILLIFFFSAIYVKKLKREVVERKKAEDALRESEERFRTIYENAPVLINALDENGRCVLWNRQCVETFGWTIDEINSTADALRLFYPDPFIRETVKRTIINKPDGRFREWHPLTKDGKILTTMWANFCLPDGKVISLGYDISERKQAEEMLRKSEKKYRVIMESMKEPIYICSKDFTIEYMNPTMIQRVGYNALGEKCFKAVHNLDKQCPWCKNEAIKAGEVHELNIISPKDNRSFYISATPVVNDDASISVLNVFRDVTGVKKMETRLQQAQKMESIGTLAGGIAHDFNNILFPIIGHTEMLLEDAKEADHFRDGLLGIYASAHRAKELVKQILTFSRQERCELKLIKIQPVIREALKFIRSSLPATIEIRQNIVSDCGIIKADPTQIHQIVMNLTTNAYHAMAETGGELKVALKEIELFAEDLLNPDMEPGIYACLTVADTGSGMDKDLSKKIFDPFFTTKEKGKGTGMGLSVVHGIVKSMNGIINVHSEPGKGSEFNVYLPVEKSSFDPEKKRSEEFTKSGSGHILLVDDEDVIVAMEKKMIERLGYSVTSCRSSIDALEIFRMAPDKFDLVISDITMPHMPGDKLAAELLEIRPDIPILLCTGFSETMSEEKALAMGIKGFLFKPIVIVALAKKIREVLDEK